MKFFFIVVIYNKNCDESKTCQALLNRNNSDEYVMIMDNSEIKNDNMSFCNELQWKYVSMNGNKGLSKAYNKAINILKDNKNDFIIWLDDDTFITDEYIENLKKACKINSEKKVFMPIIYDNNKKIISPSICTKIKNFKLKDESELKKINIKNILAINTCLAVKISVYSNYRYNEKQFLDLIDNSFFYYLRKEKIEYCILPNKIIQNFFSSEKINYEKKLKRVLIEIHDYKEYIKDKTLIEKFMCFFRTIFWGLRGSIQYKNTNFIFKVLKQFLNKGEI